MAKVAERFWESTGLTPRQIAALDNIVYQVAPLAGGAVGTEGGGSVTISPDAAQYGWFVDATPTTNEEYSAVSATSFVARTGDAAGGVDLLTTLLHEQGHVLGLGHLLNSNDVMSATIKEGVRRLPSANEAAGSVPATNPATTDYLTPEETGDPDSLGSRGANYNRVVADKTSSNGIVNYVDVNADASPNINIVLGAGSVVSAGVGNVILNVESNNFARATGSALDGIPAPIAVVFAHATVGGTINVSLAGTIIHQGDLTLELNTVNDAQAYGDAMSAGAIGGTGKHRRPCHPPSTLHRPGSNINVTGNFAV